MNKLNIIILIISIIVFFIVLLIILFRYYNNIIKEILDKINSSEETYYNKMKEKYDIVIKLINIVEEKLKIDSKTFNDFKRLNKDTIGLPKNENLLNKCYKEIIDIKDDNPNSKRFKSLRDTLSNYNDNDLHIISLRTYYNKYTMQYNNLIKRFPYNVISKIKKYRLKLLFEGQEIEEEN